MTIKLGTVISHIGQPPPELEKWSILQTMGIDVELAKKAAYKIYFEQTEGGYDENFSSYHDVYFVVNNTKYGHLFAIKYGAKKYE